MRNKDSTYADKSRYAHGGTTERTSTRLEHWERTPMRRDPTDSTYVLEDIYEGRPELLASVFYEDSRLWWVICQLNSILDVQSEFVAGTILSIPSKDRVEKELVRGGASGGIPSKREPRKSIKQIIV